MRIKALIKAGGTLLDDPVSRNAIARQIVHAAEAGTTVAVVHGGGKQMTRFLEERGIQSSFVRGLRVTTEETIDAGLKIFAGTVNARFVGSLCLAGAKAVGLTGIDAGLATAVQLDPELGFVGRVVTSEARLLTVLTDAGYLPVIACVAGGAQGEVFNVNADSLAIAIASAWNADHLIFLTDVEGVLDSSKRVIPVLTTEECRSLIDAGIATGGMQAKLNAAAEAVASGVGEVIVVKGSEPGVLNRVLAGDEIGTRIVSGSDKLT